jgi:cytochrome bd-type quinol oxidase subunit 1
MPPIPFTAPWSKNLRRSSTIAMGVLLAAVIVAFFVVPPDESTARILLTGVLIAIPIIAALCMVRGYVITESEVHIRRTGWTVRLPLKMLQTVDGNAEALQGAIRLVGNYGLFSYTGCYWSKRLGFFRVYATDPDRAIVLRYPNRTIVITPHDPQAFIIRARTLIKTREFPG